MKKEIATILLVFCLMVIGIPSQVHAQKSSNEKAYVTISSVDELKKFAREVNNGNDFTGKLIKLKKDIRFEGAIINNLTPIGSGQNNNFNGTFDGAGYIISGIDITNINEWAGIFGTIGPQGIVKNLTVQACKFVNVDRGGTIAGINWGTVENCHTTGGSLNGKQLGGIIGNNYGTILNSSNTVKIVSGDHNVGGIAAYNNGNILNSYNTGDIISSIRYLEYYAGGLVGKNGSGGIIQNCYNTGKVTLTDIVQRMGAIAGYAEGILVNNFYSEDSAKQKVYELYGTEINNKSLSKSKMKNDSFVKDLNSNIGSNKKWLKWSSGSVFPTFERLYEITFRTIKNGTIKTNYSYATQGRMVTLECIPKPNYLLSSISIKTSSGKNVKVTKKNGKYQLKMPAEIIVVNATFKKK